MPKRHLGLAPWALDLARRVASMTEPGFHPLILVVYGDGRRAVLIGTAITTEAATGGPAPPFIDQAQPRPATPQNS
jgi:hypothetical protein